MTRLRIRSVEFRREREAGWRELEELLAEADKAGLRRMSFRQLSRLPTLYRGAMSSLSVARAISLDRALLDYLERLTARAYITIYGVQHGLGRALASFLTLRFPREMRAQKWLVALAAGLVLLGTATGWLMTVHDPDNYYRLVPEQLAQGRSPTSTDDELRSVLFHDEGEEGLNVFASFLFTHNAQIGLMCFALGFAVGVPVFYLLFTNGQMLGALAGLYHVRGLSLEFWSWVLPHGVSELTAIIVCGAAGLVVARGIIAPGRHGRAVGLARAGRSAGILVLGAVVMFFIAAAFEGYFRQLVTDVGLRYVVAVLLAVLWILYFTLAGRRRT